MKPYYYVVIAYRSGMPRDYHFPLGVFETFESAITAANSHHHYRGYKYSHVIHEVIMDHAYDAGEAQAVSKPRMKEWWT